MPTKSKPLPIWSERLSGAMREHGLSDERVAEFCDLSPRTIANVRLARCKSVRVTTTKELARGLTKASGRRYTAAWLRGERVA